MAESTSNDVSAKYHTVNVCPNLPKVARNYPCNKSEDLPPMDYWMNQMKSHSDKRCKNIQHIMANGPYTSLIHNHGIFSVFLYAYNSHEDIVLSPDDVWLMICMYFSKYVCDNAEQLRSLFVDHDGKKKLTVEQIGGREPDWNYFLENMRMEIGKNVKNEVTDLLTPTFSTTTKIESLLSCATIMSTFKKYFDYEFCMTMCGIRNVHFMGTLDDWKVLRQKTEQLKNFTIPSNYGNGFDTYIGGLLPILDQFIQTYQGNVDYQFWNTVMDIKHIPGGSGRRGGDYVTGWFLRLCYGQHQSQRCHTSDIKLDPISADVTLRNKATNETKNCCVVGGFHGIESSDGRHKPVMSLAVAELEDSCNSDHDADDALKQNLLDLPNISAWRNNLLRTKK